MAHRKDPGAGRALIEIDGASGEGGGQVLRTALTLSCLTGQKFRIRNVRAGRGRPGLAPQHLTALVALVHLCGAEVEGDKLGSTEVQFTPGSGPQPGEYAFDISEAAEGGSAGSTALLAQSLILPLAFAGGESKLVLRGGTHVRWSPPFEYLQAVYLPRLAEIGIECSCRLSAWGFYPAGGGEIELEIAGIGASANLRPQQWIERGRLLQVGGIALASNLPAHIPQRMTDRARSLLAELDVTFAVSPRRVRSAGPGAGLFLVAGYEATSAGFSAHGEPGRPSERVAEEAVGLLLDFNRTKAALDPHLSDQILLPLALVPGPSAFTTPRKTRHLVTNAMILGRFLPSRVEFSERGDGLCHVTVEGVDPRD